MKLDFRQAKYQVKAIVNQRPDMAIGVLIFVTCLFVYLANGTDLWLGSSDNVPNTLLAFNWLEHHSLNFNLFKDGHLYSEGEPPYYFTEGINDDLTSRYPIGTALFTFPLYVVFFLYLKLTAWITSLTTGNSVDFLDITSKGFLPYRADFSKLAAAIVTAFTTVLFYLSLRLKFSQGIALIAAFIFAFCTSSWSLNAQDLRQHTVANLVLITIIFCLLKVNRIQGRNQKILLLIAGALCGLLPSVRVTSGIYSLAATIYVLYTFRKQAIYFLLGLPSVLLQFAWNAYYFGFDNLISGGYVKQFENRPESYKFTIEQFITAAPGLLISPSEGFFIYSPVLLFAIPGACQVLKFRAGRDEQLLICLSFAAVGLFINYSFYGSWTGGSDSYGCRFLTDILPVVCWLAAYFLARLVAALNQAKTRISQVLFAVFLSSILVSTAIQAIGAYTSTDWGTSPVPILVDRGRLWQIQDNQIQRHFNNLVARITSPISDPEQYVSGLNGTVEKFEMRTREGNLTEAINGSFQVYSKQRRFVKVWLRNTGKSQWFGYQTGMTGIGETKLRIFFIRQGETAKIRPREDKWLNISGTPKSGEQTAATGRIMFPKKPGQYQMVLDLFASGLDNSDNAAKPPLYAVNITVQPRT